jgi:3-oxoacyl-[acyl-carrier protein] reductase
VPTEPFPGTRVSIDLSNDENTRVKLGELMHEFAFDGVVNNVGLVDPEPVGDIAISRLDRVMQVNLHPALQIVQLMLPNMLANRWGRIVNITSLTVLGAVNRTSYAAAKAALTSFARTWLSNWRTPESSQM